jgi:hypothetical protein
MYSTEELGDQCKVAFGAKTTLHWSPSSSMETVLWSGFISVYVDLAQENYKQFTHIS